MRRLLFILTAFYFVFIGGTAYYNFVPAVRFFHHLFVTLLLAGWLVTRLRKGMPSTLLNLPITAAVVVWFASAIASLDPRVAFENLWFPITHTLLFFVLVDLFQQGREKLVIETQFILAALVIFITGLELGSWYFGWGIIPGTEIGWAQVRVIPLEVLRVSLAMNISTLLAGYVAPLVTLTMAAAITVRQQGQRTVLWIIMVLLLAILILTFSRGGWLSFAVALGIFLTLRLAQSSIVSKRIPSRLFIGAAVLAFAGVLVLFIVFTVSQDRRSGDEGRVDMWVSSIAITRDHPVLGIGPGLFGRAFRDYRDVSIARDKLASAHNAYLNTLSETGIAGAFVSLWLFVIIVRSWWKNWRAAVSQAEKIRLEAALAAFIGLGVHSLVDTFTITPIALLMLGIVAYMIVPRRRTYENPPAALLSDRISVIVALVIILIYGGWFVLVVDPAYSHYLNSFRGDLAEAKAAVELDPSLRLYSLQAAYLEGIQSAEKAIPAYQSALALEPTWDVGWLNLGWLELKDGNTQGAFNAFTEAQRINPLTVAPLNRAKVAEEYDLMPRTAVIATYTQALANEVANRRLPLSEFWTATEIRRDALDQYLQTAPLEVQYRVYVAQNPERAAALVPTQPQTASEWWTVGEHALTVENDSVKAAEAFTQAIQRDTKNGDYYVSRARAMLQSDKANARLDLDYAYLLGTTYENLYSVKAELASTPEERASMEQRAQPVFATGQEFAAVLYGGRMSIFDVFPELRPPT